MIVFKKLSSPFIVLIDFKFNLWVSFYSLSFILEIFLRLHKPGLFVHI